MPSEFLKAGGGLKSALRSGLPHPKGKRTLLSALGSSFEPELLGAGRWEVRTHVVSYLVGDRSWDMPLPPHPGHMLPLCPPHQRPLLPQAPTAAPPTCLSWGLQPHTPPNADASSKDNGTERPSHGAPATRPPLAGAFRTDH